MPAVIDCNYTIELNLMAIKFIKCNNLGLYEGNRRDHSI